MKKLLLITTGGTIACLPTENGYSPRESAEIFAGFEKTLKPREKRLARAVIPPKLLETLSLFSLDSTDLSPTHWRTLHTAAQNACDSRGYGGIVILHGTDTLDYTAALLYYTLRTEIPVILTGAMLPLSEEESDGFANLTDAFLAARDQRLGGVFAVFGGRIIRGDELIKHDAEKADAFRSFSGKDVGAVSNGTVTLFRKPEKAELFAYPPVDRKISVLKLSPFMTGAALDAVRAAGADGAVLESYGAGGLPERLLPAAKRLAEAMPVVLTTPCIGGVNLLRYEVGRRALQCGIRSGGSHTTAAAAVRLMLGGEFGACSVSE